ncbi:MAG: hypothetical protein HZA93_23090 [Verrucomicrobia bacterium]|nr:hypothetical protein [Verrucomicrobiota bacterium]
MNSFLRSSVSFALTTVLFAAEPAPSAPKKEEKSEWVFSLLPKTFQKNPRVDLTVITEMTPLGKKLPPVTPAKPVYYIAQSAGFQQRGHAPGHEKTLKEAEIERLLVRSLATSGYLRADGSPAQPVSLAIIYTWGSHNLLTEGDEENPVLSGEMVARNILDRAALVGGERFAAQLLKLFEEADSLALASRATPPPGGESVIGPAQMDFLNPVNLFRRSSSKNDFLVDQTANDVYYVVASAYDYGALLRKERRLYWRTRMTVAAQGVSQDQTLPTLIATAGPYFGKDMPEVEILSRRATPEGKVEIGEAVVVGTEDPAARKKAKAPPAKK